MSESEHTKAIIPARPKQLGFPTPKQLALPVVSTAALVWVGKKALSIMRAKRSARAITTFIKPAADLITKPSTTNKTARRIIIERTHISITINQDEPDR